MRAYEIMCPVIGCRPAREGRCATHARARAHTHTYTYTRPAAHSLGLISEVWHDLGNAHCPFFDFLLAAQGSVSASQINFINESHFTRQGRVIIGLVCWPTSILDAFATPDTTSPVELKEPTASTARRLFEDQMTIQKHGLNLR